MGNNNVVDMSERLLGKKASDVDAKIQEIQGRIQAVFSEKDDAIHVAFALLYEAFCIAPEEMTLQEWKDFLASMFSKVSDDVYEIK